MFFTDILPLKFTDCSNFSFGGKVRILLTYVPEDGEDDEQVAEHGGEAEAEEHAEQEHVLEAGRQRCSGFRTANG